MVLYLPSTFAKKNRIGGELAVTMTTTRTNHKQQQVLDNQLYADICRQAWYYLEEHCRQNYAPFHHKTFVLLILFYQLFGEKIDPSLLLVCFILLHGLLTEIDRQQ